MSSIKTQIEIQRVGTHAEGYFIMDGMMKRGRKKLYFHLFCHAARKWSFIEYWRDPKIRMRAQCPYFTNYSFANRTIISWLNQRLSPELDII